MDRYHEVLLTARQQRRELGDIAKGVAGALRGVPGVREDYHSNPAQKYSGMVIGHAIEDAFEKSVLSSSGRDVEEMAKNRALSTAEVDAIAALLVGEGFLEPSKGTHKRVLKGRSAPTSAFIRYRLNLEARRGSLFCGKFVMGDEQPETFKSGVVVPSPSVTQALPSTTLLESMHLDALPDKHSGTPLPQRDLSDDLRDAATATPLVLAASTTTTTTTTTLDHGCDPPSKFQVLSRLSNLAVLVACVMLCYFRNSFSAHTCIICMCVCAHALALRSTAQPLAYRTTDIEQRPSDDRAEQASGIPINDHTVIDPSTVARNTTAGAVLSAGSSVTTTFPAAHAEHTYVRAKDYTYKGLFQSEFASSLRLVEQSMGRTFPWVACTTSISGLKEYGGSGSVHYFRPKYTRWCKFRLRVVLPFPVKFVIHEIRDRRLEWDDAISQVTTIEKISGTCSLMLYTTPSKFGVSPRAFVDYEWTLDFEDGSSWGFTFPVPLEDPKGKEAVAALRTAHTRGMNFSGSCWVFENHDMEDGSVGTEMTMIIHSDLKGWLHPGLVNAKLNSHCQQFARKVLKRCCDMRDAEKKGI